jgi:hypothetical protein
MAASEGGATNAPARNSKPTAALTLLDTLARAPAAAALVVVLGWQDHGALRLTHSQLRDTVARGDDHASGEISLS